jgi:short-subunit dehydrogenase
VPHAVITGGGAGIGRALAERCAAAGFAISIIDVDAVAADATCAALAARGGSAQRIVADLGQAQGIRGVLEALKRLPPADLVVQSAGISAVGPFATSALARQQAVLDINLRAPLQLTAGLLGDERIAPGATLVFIASLAVLTSYPGAAVYAPSKAGLAAYARSLRVALAPQHINVLTVYPGPTRTAHARRYSPHNRHEQRRMPPEQLAALTMRAVQRRQAVLVPGLANRLAALLGRLAPLLTEYVMCKTILEQLPSAATATSQIGNNT